MFSSQIEMLCPGNMGVCSWLFLTLVIISLIPGYYAQGSVPIPTPLPSTDTGGFNDDNTTTEADVNNTANEVNGNESQIFGCFSIKFSSDSNVPLKTGSALSKSGLWTFRSHH